MKSIAQRYKGMTYAAAAEKIEKKYKNKNSDSLQDKAYQEEMKLLIKMHEEARASLAQREVSQLSQQPQQPMMKEGGKFPDKYKKMGFSGVDKPKKTPGASKSHAVVVKDGDSYKLIRFGQQGVSGAGSNPKSDKDKARQKSFKARHAKNIAKGKTSAAYWADKEKWQEGGWAEDPKPQLGAGWFSRLLSGNPESKSILNPQNQLGPGWLFGNSGTGWGGGDTGGGGTGVNWEKNNKQPDKLEVQRNFFSMPYIESARGFVEPGLGWNHPLNLPKTDFYDPKKLIISTPKKTGIPFIDQNNKPAPAQTPTPTPATATPAGATAPKPKPKPGTAAAAATTTSTKPAPFTFQTIPGNPLAKKVESMYPTKIKDINYKKPEEPTKGSNAYLPSYIGQGLEALTNLGLIASSEKRSPVFNPYESEVRQKMDSMRVDLDPVRQSIQSNVNAAVNKMSSMSRSAANLKSNLQNIYANMNNTISNVDMQQQQQLNQIRQSQASTINSLGVNKQQAITLAKEINDRNRAAVQSAVSKLGSQATDFGKFMTRMKVNEGQNLMTAKIYSDMFRSFGIDSNFVEKVSKGDFSGITDQDMIKLKEASPDMHKQFSDFLKQQGQETAEAATPDDKKKSEIVTQQPANTQQGSTAPALPQASREQVQQAVTTALSTRTGNAPAPATATATPAATQNPGKQMNAPRTSFDKTTSAKDMDQAIDQILNFEETQGSSTGTGLSNYGIASLNSFIKEDTSNMSDSEIKEVKKKAAKEYIKTNIAPLVASVPGSVEEKRSLMDHWFNSGTDGRIYAYQEYLRRTDPNNTTGWKDAEGKWKDRNKFREATKRDDGKYGYTNPQLDQEMTKLYNSIPPDQRRTILKSGRDWYYQNINVGSGAYEASWKDRVEETGD